MRYVIKLIKKNGQMIYLAQVLDQAKAVNSQYAYSYIIEQSLFTKEIEARAWLSSRGQIHES